MGTLWCSMWEKGPRGNSAAYSALSWFSLTSSATHKQIGLFWCLFLGGWVCVHFRSLWFSPINSPPRLELLPPLQLPQVFSFRGFEALFPRAGTLGFTVCLSPQFFLLVYLHADVGPPSPPARTLLQVLSTLAACLRPSYWSG